MLDMIFQDSWDLEGYSHEPPLMDWCRAPPVELSFQPTTPDPPSIPTQDQDEWKLKETSSYGKNSCILPVSFFDIQSNIQLLNECNPLSIKVVDCDKHPWYYKKYTRSHAQDSTLENMKDSEKEPSNNPSIKIARVDTVKCIDLTENTPDNAKTIKSDTINKVNPNKIVINNNNKMSQMTSAKRKELYQSHKHHLTKEDLEKQMACSRANFSKIDLKHNTGLVGLKITPAIGLNHMPFNKKQKKKRKNKKPTNIENNKNSIPINIENNNTDDCFSEASKSLSRLGTIIVPVENRDQCQNVEKDNTKNTFQFKVPPQSPVHSASKQEPNRRKLKPNQRYYNDVPMGASLLNINQVNNERRHEYKENNPSSTAKLVQKIDEHVKAKQVTGIEESDKVKQDNSSRQHINSENIKPACLPKDIQIKSKTEERSKDVVISRSKSPVFPCNNKQKPQSELEKYLRTNDKAHIEQQKNMQSSKTDKDSDLVKVHENSNMVFFQNWPESVSIFKDKTPSLPLQSDKNKTVDGENVSQCQYNISTIKSNTENIKDLNCKPKKPMSVVKSMTNTANLTLKSMLECPNRCPQLPTSNVQTDQAVPQATNKDSHNTNGIGFIINNNNPLSQKTSNNFQNARDKNLVALYRQFFSKSARIKPIKPGKKNEATLLPKVRPPVQTVAPNNSLPEQTQVTKKQDPTVYGNRPSAIASQNIDAGLPKQQIPAHVPTNCSGSGMSDNLAQHPSVYLTNLNGCSMENTNMYYSGWDPRLHFPIPPLMCSPPLFVPPPPLPTSLDKVQHMINELAQVQSKTNKLIKEAKKIKTKKYNKTISNPTVVKNTSNGTVNNTVIDTPVFNISGPNRSPSEETKRKEINTPSRELHLPSATKKPNILPVLHQNKSAVVKDRSKDSLLKKNETMNKPNTRSIFDDLTITPVKKPSVVSTTPDAAAKISINNKSQEINRNNIVLDEKKDNNNSLSQANKNNVPLQRKIEPKPKAGPLCMKNKTGPFAVKNASFPALNIPAQTVTSQPKKGYSPPILPIPTFQTALAQTQELEVTMRLKIKEKPIINPVANIHLYPVQNKPNNNYGDKDSRKRLHFDVKDTNEVKPVKKISLEDYKNRSFGVPNDPFGMPGKKYPRKSENTTKSVTSLADVVNRNVVHEL